MATDMYMKFSDNINGEAGGDHPNEIKVISWSWGMTQSGDMHTNTGGGAGKVDVQNLTFTHFIDSATPILMQKCCDGSPIATADLSVYKAGGASPLAYMKIQLQHCIIAGVSPAGSEGVERITEHVTLNFRQFKVEYTSQKTASGVGGTTVPMTWNIASNKSKLE